MLNVTVLYVYMNTNHYSSSSTDPPVVPQSLRRILEEIDFDSPVPYSPASAKPLANTPIVDDECYTGAEGQLNECADFDPVTSG